MVEYLKFPELGEGIEEGEITEWLNEKGDKVKKGDPIVVVDTMKFAEELEAPSDGVLKEKMVSVGDKVSIGDKIASITEE